MVKRQPCKQPRTGEINKVKFMMLCKFLASINNLLYKIPIILKAKP